MAIVITNIEQNSLRFMVRSRNESHDVPAAREHLQSMVYRGDGLFANNKLINSS
jgi:hypothetical protein